MSLSFLVPPLSFFEWCETTWLGALVRNSAWLFPVIESVHLLALAVMGGTVLLVDLRLLGLGLTGRSVRELAGETQRYMTAALVVLIVTGVGLFLSEAIKCFYSTPFWIKMGALATATIFTYTVRRLVVFRAEPPPGAKVVAVVSLALWFTVAASGRWIGFSG
jgi:hypothetical protein